MTAPEVANMQGGAVLAFLRDVLADEADRRRTLDEQFAALGYPPLPEREIGTLAIAAASDVFTLTLAAGQAAKTDKKPPPGWVKRIADQARVVFILATAAREEPPNGEVAA